MQTLGLPPGDSHTSFLSGEDLPACSQEGMVQGWEQSHACQLHYTLRAQGTGVKPVTREPGTGVTRGRGPPGLSLPRTVVRQEKNLLGGRSGGERQSLAPGQPELQSGQV